MAVEIQINGTALNPQPRTATWELQSFGGKLDGTDSLGAYDILVLRSPPARGGTANWNWNTFENQTLSSVQAMPRGQTMKNGSATTYNSGVVSKPIMVIPAPPGDYIDSVELRVAVIT
jgi:hypothetical protein